MKLAAILGIPKSKIEKLKEEDLREWAAWANEPIRSLHRSEADGCDLLSRPVAR